jgi:hypothetical protein
MRPVQFVGANMVWTGPPGVGDLHAVIEDGDTTSVWTLTPEERAAVAAGANVALRVTGRQPPVALYVTDVQGTGEDDPAARERLRAYAEAGT